eukprot:s1384_g1.t1
MPRGEIDPGLGRVLSALDKLGSPQHSLKGRVLHVAGTNGKGSVCAMLFSALRQAKLRVAMFTSPHLVEPSDAFRLAEDGQDQDFPNEQLSSLQDEIVELCRPAEEADARTLSLTSFELQVVMALTLFARRQVDVAILEVGMGGRDDATNVLIEPAACAISSIAMDHEKFLGSTREEIAGHKAGIFQANRPALVATSGMSQSVKKVIADCAEAVHSLPVTWVEPAEVAAPTSEEAGEMISEVQVLRVRGFSEELRLPLLGQGSLGRAREPEGAGLMKAMRRAFKVVILVCSAFAALTLRSVLRVSDWQDSETLFIRDGERQPHSSKTQFNLGITFMQLQVQRRDWKLCTLL